MNFKMLVIIPLMVMVCACGDATQDSSLASANLSLPVGALFDATGTWKMESTTCDSFPLPTQFDNVVQSISGNVQTFTVGSATLGNVVVFPSEGTLDTQTGAYMLCYGSSLSECGVKCTGTVDTTNHVTLGCNVIANNGACTIVLQK